MVLRRICVSVLRGMRAGLAQTNALWSWRSKGPAWLTIISRLIRRNNACFRRGQSQRMLQEKFVGEEGEGSGTEKSMRTTCERDCTSFCDKRRVVRRLNFPLPRRGKPRWEASSFSSYGPPLLHYGQPHYYFEDSMLLAHSHTKRHIIGTYSWLLSLL